MNKLFLSFMFLVLGTFNDINCFNSDPSSSNYDPDGYQAFGSFVGACLGGLGARAVVFASIHKAFKTHPIISPYKRFCVKTALATGYVVISCFAGSLGAFVADEYENRMLTSEQRQQKYWKQVRNKFISFFKGF